MLVSFQSFVESIQEELQKFPEDERDEVIILFSAHSLPMSVSDCQESVVCMMTGLVRLDLCCDN